MAGRLGGRGLSLSAVSRNSHCGTQVHLSVKKQGVSLTLWGGGYMNSFKSNTLAYLHGDVVMHSSREVDWAGVVGKWPDHVKVAGHRTH